MKLSRESKAKISETDLNKSVEVLDYLEKDNREKEKLQERCKSVFSISTSYTEDSTKDQVDKSGCYIKIMRCLNQHI